MDFNHFPHKNQVITSAFQAPAADRVNGWFASSQLRETLAGRFQISVLENISARPHPARAAVRTRPAGHASPRGDRQDALSSLGSPRFVQGRRSTRIVRGWCDEGGAVRDARLAQGFSRRESG